ncbi:MAG: tRNA (5-methylaminomethyl-2-thiouridine)(34)-methyltransferase MnmD [Chitinophagaceae bacterium]|nr:tRNA (5-methylaminomethyl-2-thiouridine)(34)-methyltransferase MnmD [Chitinophagaceae bacterium]
MNRRLFTTKDGSKTVEIPELDVTYHSRHGAFQESVHVFREAGLEYLKDRLKIQVFEMGFGSGLNALLALEFSIRSGIEIVYEGFEKFPLDSSIYEALDYSGLLNNPILVPLYHTMCECEWNQSVALTEKFTFTKRLADIHIDKPTPLVDCIFFDAFAPAAQPEMWTSTIFSKMFDTLKSGGILVTYCSKSSVQKAMKEAGFEIEKLPGPKWKREIVRAKKS